MISRLNLKALFILFALVSFVVVAQEEASDTNEEADEDNVEELEHEAEIEEDQSKKAMENLGTDVENDSEE